MKTIIALFIALVISPAQAALLVEPLIGYSFNVKSSSPETDDLTKSETSGGSGVGYGGRLGYQNFGFQVGLDYLASSLDMNDKDFDKNFDTSEWAGFVGFKFPVLLRVYAGYIFSATGETKDDTSGKVSYAGGSGPKFGVGFTGIPFLAVNLEYRNLTFDEIKFAGTKYKVDTDVSALFLNLSLPLTF